MSRITFVTPHLRRTSGGVYVILSFARALAALGHDVTLAVEDGRLRRVAGVRVSTARPRMARADAVIVPADNESPDRYTTERRPVVLLHQGTDRRPAFP